ncbi:MAG: putative signal transduction histidine kinase [Frankiales bacterium]|nr:putative signal transduction histidine kinase [Frankiales bacterium]
MTTAAPFAHRRVVRAGEGRLLGGVAAGVASHLGLPPRVVRLAFLALTLANGVGLAMYGALWVVVPQDPDRAGGVAPARARDRDRAQLLAAGVIAVGGLLLLQRFGLSSPALIPLLFAAAGIGLVWQQADAAQRARWRTAGGTRRTRLLAFFGGGILLAFGLIGFLATIGELGQAREGLLSTFVVVLGLAVLTGPWWLRMASDLRAERRERIRSQERAEVAAHVHDSVLQTLALIRKASDDPREVNRLARTQERELRGWLYASPSAASADASLAAALEQVAAEVEEVHGVTVETVVVGDAATDPSLLALVAAAREALVNAARHSGATSVSLYAEVGAECVEVFVRDRGDGFDPAAIPDDRFGVAQSIVGRMERHGGTAVVRSSTEGTEVRLEVRRG